MASVNKWIGIGRERARSGTSSTTSGAVVNISVRATERTRTETAKG